MTGGNLPQPARLLLLLRGINVGGTTTLDMGWLCQAVVAGGHTEVRTHLRTGNVVLTTSGLPPRRIAQDLEDAIRRELGTTVPVLTRTREELAAVVEANPLAALATDPARLMVVFLSAPPPRGMLDAIDHERFLPEAVRAVGNHLFLWLPNGITASRIARTVSERRLGVVGTARNWNTVTRLLTLLDQR